VNACVIRTGVANTASVCAALARCGLDPTVTGDAERVASSPFVVLPGVGSFGVGMESLRACGAAAAIAERVRAGRPTLAVCLGLQLLARESEETPGVSGLGVIDAPVTRFPVGVCTPQFGWNRVEPKAESGPVEPGYAYFANSYRLTSAPPGWGVAWADHGGAFVAALWDRGVLACQFHPEVSGPWGLSLIRRWIATGGGVQAC